MDVIMLYMLIGVFIGFFVLSVVKRGILGFTVSLVNMIIYATMVTGSFETKRKVAEKVVSSNETQIVYDTVSHSLPPYLVGGFGALIVVSIFISSFKAIGIDLSILRR